MTKRLLLAGAAALAIVASAAGAQAATLLFDLSSPTGNITNTHTYGTGSLTIVAKGFNWSGGTADLYGKHAGGDENGLGLNNDPTGDHEIHYHSGYVQLDMHNLFGLVAPGSVTFGTNSTTGGEQWSVYGSNQSGGTCGSTPLCGVTFLVSGTNEAVGQALPNFGTYRYYDFVETGTGGGKNFLITNVQARTVPEPATWGLMLMGFGGLGAMLRRRRSATATA